MRALRVEDGTLHRLPGRDWWALVGPDEGGEERFILGVAEFPAGSDPGPHVHEGGTEVIYILAGEGEIRSEGEVHRLERGVAIHIEEGREHRIVNTGDTPLRMITLLAPPVVPGSYDR